MAFPGALRANQGRDERPRRDVAFVLTVDGALFADTGTTAQLPEAGGRTLSTEYRLTFEGDGSSASEASAVAHVSLDSFLNPSMAVMCGDCDDVANAGSDSATQTITASWIGP